MLPGGVIGIDGERIVADGDEASILHGAEQAFAETYARDRRDDPNALHLDTWHGIRYRG